MNIRFNVHGVNKTKVSRPVKMDEETVQADVDCLEVELTTEAEVSGSLTLRFTGKDIAEAEKAFVPGEMVEAPFTSLGKPVTARTRD